MNLEEFHKNFEEHSDNVFGELSQLNESALLALIGDQNHDPYQIWEGKDNYQVWRALATNGTSQSVEPLFAIVTNLSYDYLIRYHACTALFAIASIEDDSFKGEVQYGLDQNRQKVDQLKAFEKLKGLLSEKFK